MSVKGYGPYPAEVIGIHDGDTITVRLDLGFDVAFTSGCRFYGINAPELASAAGKASLAFLQEHLKVGDKVSIESHDWDKFGGRFLGIITLATGENLNTLMVSSDHAKVWDGKGKKPA